MRISVDDKRLSRIEIKLDDISDHLSSIDSTVAAQHVSLRDHIRRTAILEKEVVPLKKSVNQAYGALKLITLLVAIAALVEFLKHL